MDKKENSNKTGADLLKETNLTYDDYAALEDDDNRYELAAGQLQLMSPGPSITHQMISFEMQKIIANRCESDYIILNAPLDVILAANEVRQPDLVLVHHDRMNIISNRGIKGAPDLVVEILSPSTLKRDKIDKLHSYELHQIREYWIVEPKAAFLEQYVLHDKQYKLVNIFQGDERVTSSTIPCISFTMAEVTKNIPSLPD